MPMTISATPPPLKAPYPYYGGKAQAAPLIWQALGDCPNVVEPFFGSGAVLLNRPHVPKIETVNDLDAHIPNFWRALKADPEGLARACDTPVSEVDMHAMHTWLIEPQRRQAFVARMMGDPDYYDLLRAARWCTGLCMWIGAGWCSGNGPWQSVDGQLVHLGNAGEGVSRKLVHLGDTGQGVHRKRVHLGDTGQGEGLREWFAALQARLRHVRVCCGDWTRVLGHSVTMAHGLTGIYFDPPYAREESRDEHLYTVEDLSVAHVVRDWCVSHGDHPCLRIVLSGYDTTHDALLAKGWRKVAWHTHGGYGNQRKNSVNPNRYREMLWLSPHCLRTDQERQLTLWGAS